MLSQLPNQNRPDASKFKATLLWQNLIHYVFRQVRQKRRRLLLRGVGPTECFTGSDVCDTVLLYLLMDNDNFKTSDITRVKALKLCQLLLEHQVFEPLSGSSVSLDKKFDDDGGKYYKFTSTLIEAILFKQGTDDSTRKSSSGTHRPAFHASDARRTLKECEPMEMEEMVLCNPHTNTEINCDGSIIHELLNLTSAKQSSVLKDTNGKQRVSATATSQMRKMYNDCVFANKRSSLNCESAFRTGSLPRTISTGTGTAGFFKRKYSALDLAGESQVGGATDPLPSLRRSLRQRRLPADQIGYNEFSRCHRTRVIHSCPSATECSSMHSHPLQPGDMHSHPLQPGDASQVDSSLSSRESTVVDVPFSAQDTEIQCGKTVKKLAKLTGEVIFSPTAIAEIRQEIALSQLSHLLELPFLEGLVCTANHSKENPGYDNTVFFNIDQHHIMGLGASDSWVEKAIEVFDYMPNGHKTTFDYQIGINPSDYKLALYKSILKSYRSRTEPLFPACHEQIHLAVFSLIMSGSEQKAVLAMRLAAILLPCYRVAELATLLLFLHTVSTSAEPKLRPVQNNNDAVLNDFSGIFFMGCKLLSMDQRRILLLLMMRHSDKLTSTPSSVQTALEQTMQNVTQGDNTPTPSTLFCNTLTLLAYQQQQMETTESAIISLVKKVIDDTTIPLKEKQKHIKQFHKHHAAIMVKHFSDIA